MGASYLAVAMAQYVTFQGMQLPHFHDSHLRTLHPTKLREHANLLYSTIGHSNLGRAVPVHDHELIEFIIFVQCPLGSSSACGRGTCILDNGSGARDLRSSICDLWRGSCSRPGDLRGTRHVCCRIGPCNYNNGSRPGDLCGTLNICCCSSSCNLNSGIGPGDLCGTRNVCCCSSSCNLNNGSSPRDVWNGIHNRSRACNLLGRDSDPYEAPSS